MTWSDELRIRVRHIDGRLRKCRQAHIIIDLARQVQNMQGYSVSAMTEDDFSLQCLEPAVLIQRILSASK